jgi:hypothetical protein
MLFLPMNLSLKELAEHRPLKHAGYAGCMSFGRFDGRFCAHSATDGTTSPDSSANQGSGQMGPTMSPQPGSQLFRQLPQRPC